MGQAKSVRFRVHERPCGIRWVRIQLGSDGTVNRIQRGMYRAFVGGLRVIRRLACRPRVWGREHIPPGAKIYVTNHISSTDPWYVLPAFTEPVHAIVGPGYEPRLLAWVLDRFEQINAMPAHRGAVIEKALEYLKRDEPIWITPEGDIQPDGVLSSFFHGVAKIYRRCRVPIVPIAMVAPRRAMRYWPIFDTHIDGHVYKGVFLVGDYFCINIGHPITPEIREDVAESGDNQRIVGEVRSAVQALIDEVQAKGLWRE
jgi:1-acyl-sn-glycerol-3-phosphate acyltransferase